MRLCEAKSSSEVERSTATAARLDWEGAEAALMFLRRMGNDGRGQVKAADLVILVEYYAGVAAVDEAAMHLP